MMAAVIICLPALMAAGNTAVHAATGGRWRLLLAKLTPENRFAQLDGVQLISIRGDSKLELRFRTEMGQSSKVPMAEVITARNLAFSPNSTGKWRVFLKDGGWICGHDITSHGENFRINTSFGMITVPLNDAVGLGKINSGWQAHRAAAHDRVYFLSGGVLKGTFSAAGMRGVEMHSSLGVQWIAWPRIEKLVLGGLPMRKTTGAKFAVTLLNGSRLKATSIQLASGLFSIHTVVAVALKVPISSLGAINTIKGKATWLASVHPEAYRQTPLFGQPWPLQRNRNAVGDPLRVGDRIYAHGLGMRAPCTVTYHLGGQYQYLLFAAQMDDSAEATGRGHISVSIDGHHVYTSRVLTAGMPVHFVRLPLHAAESLSISARSDSYLATRCRIDLLDAALLRK